METNNLGVILKERREEKGLRLRQLATLSGVSASHITRVEKGERFPSGHILRKLTKPLGFGEVELLKLAGFMSEDVDDRLDRLKGSIKGEIIDAMLSLCKKIDSAQPLQKG